MNLRSSCWIYNEFFPLFWVLSWLVVSIIVIFFAASFQPQNKKGRVYCRSPGPWRAILNSILKMTLMFDLILSLTRTVHFIDMVATLIKSSLYDSNPLFPNKYYSFSNTFMSLLFIYYLKFSKMLDLWKPLELNR